MYSLVARRFFALEGQPLQSWSNVLHGVVRAGVHSKEIMELAARGIAQHEDEGEPRYFVLATHDCAVAGFRDREILAGLT